MILKTLRPHRSRLALAWLRALSLALLTLTCPALQAAPEQDLRPADYTGYVMPNSYNYGETMAAGGDWLAVGAPGSQGIVLLWKRETPAGASSPAWVRKQDLAWPDADGTDWNYFGRKLAMDATGTRLLVGSHEGRGRAHIYQRQGGGDVWTLEGTLLQQAGDPESVAFGDDMVLSADGSVAAVTCPDNQAQGSPGHLDVFTRGPEGWAHATRLTNDPNVSMSGATLAMHGHTIYDGRPWARVNPGSYDSSYGKILVYERAGTSSAWTQSRQLTAPYPQNGYNYASSIQVHADRLYVLSNGSSGTLYEYSITESLNLVTSLTSYAWSSTWGRPLFATDGTYLAVGDRDLWSRTYIYRRRADQSWVSDGGTDGLTPDYQQHCLLWSSGDLLSGGFFDPPFDRPGYRDGVVRITRRVDSEWNYQGTIQPAITSYRLGTTEFGQSLAQEGDWVMVGAPDTSSVGSTVKGMVYAYQKTPQGTLRLHSLLPTSTDPGPVPPALPHSTDRRVGMQVSMSAGRVATGGLIDSATGRPAVGIYTYSAPQDRWVLESLVTAPAGRPNYDFGDALSLHGDRLAVGQKYEKRVYVFRRSGTQWILEADIPGPTPPAGTAPTFFGSSVALSATTLLVGAPGNSGGLAYFYERDGSRWALAAKFTNPARADAFLTGPFAAQVALAGSRALVSRQDAGSMGAVYQRSSSGTWTLHSSLPAAIPGTFTPPAGMDEYERAFGSSSISLAFTGTSAAIATQGGVSLTLLRGSTWTLPGRPFSSQMTRGVMLTPDHRLLGGTYGNTVQVRSTHVSPEVYLLAEVVTDTTEAGVRHLDLGEHAAGSKLDTLLDFSLFGRGLLPAQATATLSGDVADFSLPKSAWVVPAAALATCTLRFSPKTTGLKQVTLTFTSDAPGDTPRVFIIRAQVAAQAVPVTWLRQPQSQLVPHGTPIQSFTAQVQGTRPLIYRWLFNGKTIPYASSPTLHASTPGLYQLEVTNPTGKHLSDKVALGIVEILNAQPFIPPQILTLQGKTCVAEARLSGPALKVAWWRGTEGDPQPLSDGGRLSGTGKPALSIRESQAADSGRYIARVTMPDPAAAGAPLSVDVPVDIHIVRLPQVTLEYDIEEPLSLGEYFYLECHHQFDTTAHNYAPVYTAKGLPPGLQIQSHTGQIEGTPTKAGLYQVSLTVKLGPYTSAPLVIQLLVKPSYLETPGFYWGIIQRDEHFPLGGSVSLDLRPDGTITGSILTGSRRSAFTSRRSIFGLESAATFTLARFLSGVTCTGKLGSNGYDTLALLVRPDRRDGSGEDIQLADLRLIRPLARATPPPPEALGRHSLALLGTGDASTAPIGHSFGTLEVSADRSVKISAQLADGGTLTTTGWYVDADASGPPRILLHALDKAGHGCLLGELPLGAYTDAPQERLYWTRLPVPGRVYPEGYADFTLRSLISRYAPQVPGQQIQPGPHLMELSLPEQASAILMDAPFTLSGAKLTATFSTPGSPDRLLSPKLTITTASGLFTGQFTLSDSDPADDTRRLTRSVKFQGIFLPEHQLAAGYFLLPELPDPLADPPTKATTSPIRSGGILIEPD